MMVVFIAILVIVVLFLVRWLGGARTDGVQRSTPEETPEGILKQRFAKGEIDKEEYEERMRVLKD